MKLIDHIEQADAIRLLVNRNRLANQEILKHWHQAAPKLIESWVCPTSFCRGATGRRFQPDGAFDDERTISLDLSLGRLERCVNMSRAIRGLMGNSARHTRDRSVKNSSTKTDCRRSSETARAANVRSHGNNSPVRNWWSRKDTNPRMCVSSSFPIASDSVTARVRFELRSAFATARLLETQPSTAKNSSSSNAFNSLGNTQTLLAPARRGA
jgi:hypothetical protein